MTQVACRWPGGMIIALIRMGAPPSTVTLAGPHGVLPIAPSARAGLPTSREPAVRLMQGVRDAARRLAETADDEFTQQDYGMTEVSGAFWEQWLVANAETDA